MSKPNLDRRVTFERWVEDTGGEFNEPLETWIELGTVHAQKTDLSDREQLTAGGELSSHMARFVVRSSELTRGLVSADRLKLDGNIWNIKGTKEIGGRRSFIELTAVVGSDEGA